MSHEYLSDLNKEQRRAVEHGIDTECATTAPPLLVIAGAGSGKTKTLAHRVAHLVVNGVDPHRILLLTSLKLLRTPDFQRGRGRAATFRAKRWEMRLVWAGWDDATIVQPDEVVSCCTPGGLRG